MSPEKSEPETWDKFIHEWGLPKFSSVQILFMDWSQMMRLR